MVKEGKSQPPTLEDIQAGPHGIEQHTFRRDLREGRTSVIESGFFTVDVFRNPEGKIVLIRDTAIDPASVKREIVKNAPSQETP